MRKNLLIIVFLLLASLGFAQTNGLNYKALITNNGTALNTQNVNVKFTILQNGTTAVYQETQSATTDANGIVSLSIGEGNTLSGNFNTIDWSSGAYSLKVEIDTGNGYTDYGTNELKYVPFAKYAETAGNTFSGNFNDLSNVPAGLSDGDDVNDADHNPTNEIQTLSFDNGSRQLTISNGNTVTIPAGSASGGDGWGTQVAATDSSINGDGTSGNPLGVNPNAAVFNGWDKNASDDFSGNFNDLSNIPAGLSDGDDVNDADHDPSNELQTISKSGSTVTLSNGGGSFTDAVNDADHNPTNEIQTLSVSGNQLTISSGNTVTLPTGSGGDQWGSQVVQSDGSLSGNGTSSSPLSVNTNSSAFNGWDKNAADDFSGSYVDLTDIPADIADGDDVDDADHDPNNEIQTLSINGNQLSISSGNSVTLPAGGGGAQDIDDLSDAKVSANSVFLGQGAGSNDDGTDNSNIALGADALFSNTSGYNNSALGTEALSSNTTGKNNVAVGSNALLFNTNKDNLVAVGSNALYKNATGASANYEAINNTAVGSYAMYNNTKGSYNLALGWQTLYSNVSANKNTAVGTKAMYSSTSGNENTATGYHALIDNTTGDYNVAIGSQALANNATGYSNVAVGVKALYNSVDRNNLVAVGDSALYNNTTGAYNTAVGSEVLLNNINGDDNTGIGYHSLFNNTSGVSNTALGSGALKYNGTGSYNVAIGKEAYFYGDWDNTICIGYNSGAMSNADNRVEIGNSSMTWIGGEVNWSTYSDRRIKKDIEENVAGLDFITRLRPVTYHLDIHKQNQMKSRSKNSKEEAEWDSKYDIEQIRMTGFIAQEVEQAAQQAGYDFSGVQKSDDDIGMYSVRYAEFVVPLVKAVQEQQEIIKNQQNQIDNLQAQIDELKRLIKENK